LADSRFVDDEQGCAGVEPDFLGKTFLAFSRCLGLYHIGQSAAVDAPTGFHRSNPNGRGQMTFPGSGRAEEVQHFGATDELKLRQRHDAVADPARAGRRSRSFRGS
jgi:hypothetical protein